MHKLLILFILLFSLFSPLVSHLEAKGVLVKVEHFNSVSFSPKDGETASLTYLVLKNSYVTVRIYNFFGKRIFEKKIGFFYEGKHSFFWDGKDYNGRPVKPGFYKCEILASESGYGATDSDYAVIFVKDLRPQPGISKLQEEDSRSTPFKISGSIRTITETDTKGGFNNPSRAELNLDFKGRHGREWKYNLRLFPYYDPAKPFQWSDFIEGKVGYYAQNWNIEAGYHNLIEGYSDLLNIFADYKMPQDRTSISAVINPAKKLNLNCGAHYAFSTNEYAIESGISYNISDATKINVCTVNKIVQNYSNNVIAAWAEFSGIEGTAVVTEISGSLVSTTQPLQTYGLATKGEVKYGFPRVPEKYGNFSVSCAAEYIQKNFVCELADLQNGNDNMGLEITGEYGTNANIFWLEHLNLEIKKAYFTSIDRSVVRQRFRPTLSAQLLPHLTVRAHYDYTGIEGAVNFLRRIRSASGELYYVHLPGKWEAGLGYATVSTTADSRTEYTSTNIMFNYHLTEEMVPYVACEKIVKMTQGTIDADCYFWKIGLSWDFSLWQKQKTNLRLQAGYVISNITGQENKVPYYAELEQQIFEIFGFVFSYGSLSVLEPLQKFSLQAKLKF